MLKKIIIGVDPGNSSGYFCVLAVMEDDSYEAILISMGGGNVYEWSKKLDEAVEPYIGIIPIFGFVEEITFIKSMKGAISMHRNIGNIEMWFVLRKVPMEWVKPLEWQKYVISKAPQKKTLNKLTMKRLLTEWRKNNISEADIKMLVSEKEKEVSDFNKQLKASSRKKQFAKMQFKAMQLFPDIKVTEKNSQALLIAYCKMKEGKMLAIPQEETI